MSSHRRATNPGICTALRCKALLPPRTHGLQRTSCRHAPPSIRLSRGPCLITSSVCRARQHIYTGRAGYCSERAAAVGFASTWSDPSLPDFPLLSESSRGQSQGWWTGVQPYTHTRTLTIVHGVLRCVFKPSLGRNQGRLGSTIGTSVVLRRAHAMSVYARPAHTDAFLRRWG